MLRLEMAVQEMWTRALARNAPAVGKRDGIDDIRIWSVVKHAAAGLKALIKKALGGGDGKIMVRNVESD